MDGLTILLGLTALCTGMVAGIFFAFSTFIMRALHRLSDSEGIRAMQAINLTAVSFGFMTLLFGTAVLSIIVGVLTVLTRIDVYLWSAIGAAGSYLIGVIVVTIVANVPLNNRLADVTPESPDGVIQWVTFQRSWVRWNHLRTCASTLAAAFWLLTLVTAG